MVQGMNNKKVQYVKRYNEKLQKENKNNKQIKKYICLYIITMI